MIHKRRQGHGAKCPHCGEIDNRVLDSRYHLKEQALRRRRACNICKLRWNTYEIPVDDYETLLSEISQLKLDLGTIRRLLQTPVDK